MESEACMTKFGEVVSRDEATGTVTVRYTRPEACEKCGACGGKGQEKTISLPGDCQPGEWVRVELPDSRFLNAAAVAYGLPLLGFLAGLLSGWFVGKSEGAAVLFSLVGLGAGLWLLRLAERRVSGKPEWSPRIAAVYPDRAALDAFGCPGKTTL